jgi:hypothetical protein
MPHAKGFVLVPEAVRVPSVSPILTAECRQDSPGGEDGGGVGNQGNLSVGDNIPAPSRKRKGHGWLVAIKADTVNPRLRHNPPAMGGEVSVPIDGVSQELRIKRWPAKRGREYVEVLALQRHWDPSNPDELRCLIANGMGKCEPGRMWTLRELQQRIGHGVTEEMLRPAIHRMDRDGWVIVVRGQPRKDSLRVALIRP